MRRARSTPSATPLLVVLAAAVALASPRVSASAPVGPGLYENGQAPVVLEGPWTTSPTTTASGGSFATLYQPGYAELTFAATGVSWLSRRAAYLGTADVLLDGVKVKTVDLYSSATQFRQTVYSVSGLAAGSHTLRITRTGTKNAASSGAGIVVDAFSVLDVTPPTPPRGLTSSAIRTGFQVAWTAPADADLAGFKLYRRSASGVAVLVAVLPKDVTSFADVGLADASTYSYTVTAYDASGNTSAPSSALTVTTAAEPSYDAVGYAACPQATVTVSTFQELTGALAVARAGSVIHMSPGTYSVPWGVAITVQGTASHPVWLCGPRTAVISGAGVTSNGGLRVSGSSHLNIAGITVRNSQKGISVLTSSFVAIADVLVEHIGEEAIHFKENTTDSIVVGNTIRDTGLQTAMYGEGVYVGTAKGNWCAYNGCAPDASDRNSVVFNDIRGTTAEPIDLKEGASDGLVAHNTLDGSSMKTGTALVSVQTDRWVIAHNVGSNSPQDGVDVWQVYDVYGIQNIVYDNHFSGSVSGYAVRLAFNELGNVAGCDNVPAPNSLGVSNKVCQP